MINLILYRSHLVLSLVEWLNVRSHGKILNLLMFYVASMLLLTTISVKHSDVLAAH